MHRIFIFLLILLCGMPVVGLNADFPYEVTFKGVEDHQTLEALKSASRLMRLSIRTPQSPVALRRRAEADLEAFVKVLQGRGFYSAKVDMQIDLGQTPAKVFFVIDEGTLYTLGEVSIRPIGSTMSLNGSCQLSPELLGLQSGDVAYADKIVKAEGLLLKSMAEQGYPLASIAQRQVFADIDRHTLAVEFTVDSGPLATFGPTTISGVSAVQDSFFQRKIAWREGEPFDQRKVADTQAALEKSALFRAVTVTHSDHVGNGGELSMEIHVVEAHHRTIAAGVGYSSQRGIGLTAEWDHRNVRSQGERVHAGINIWQNTQEAKLSYTLPDFGCPGRDLIWQADLQHTSTKGYADVSGGVSALLEHTYHERLRFSYGMMYKMISTSHSDNNALFHLWKLPMHLRWSNADSVLNPTVGKSINLKVTPSLQLATPQFFYCPITCTATYYKPLSADRRIVFAAKASLGTILGVTNHAIPPSERFYAGNETTLRGYQYQTVSPLDHQNKPIGGRSMAVGSVELRGMITDTIEGVGFYEIGNVYKNAYPDLMSKPLQSVGAGVRYHTPVGPIRFDVAVPLNPRPGIDKGYQFYMSIGQSF